MSQKYKPSFLGVCVAAVAAIVFWSLIGPPARQRTIEPAALQSEQLTGVTYNLTLTNADTEYSQALPETCSYFTIQARTSAAVRWSWETGKVATPTAPYNTMKAGSSYSTPEKIKVRSGTLYFGTASAGTVVEIVAYQ